jgi:Spy/CpxP family protein refolding chaperone
MRKNLIIAAGLALSLAGVASAQQGERRDTPRRERGQVADSMRGPRGERGHGPDGLLLKGITLSEGQRAQIAQLNKTQRESMDPTREQRRTEMEQVRAARQRGDTAAVRAAMQKNRLAMEQARTRHIAAVRNLLTAEQRVQFDKNVAELQAKVAQRGQGGEGRGLRGPGKRKGGR